MGLYGPTKKQMGERSQAHIIARLLEVEYTVLTPLEIVPAMIW